MGTNSGSSNCCAVSGQLLNQCASVTSMKLVYVYSLTYKLFGKIKYW